MVEWLARPHVAEWWDGDPTLADVEDDYLPVIEGDGADRAYIAIAGGKEIGFIQSYQAIASHEHGWWRDQHDPGVYGIDQFLADENSLGRGLGTAMVRAFLDTLFAQSNVTRVQTDPSPRNARAIRCYEKAGFYPHAVVDTPDGKALLMYAERPSA